MKSLPSFILMLITFSLPALAEHAHNGHSHGAASLMPSISKHAGTLNLSMDKSELIRLEEDAASVIVGNPHHANVLLDSSRLLVIVPRAPGATHFMVLNNAGNVILEKHIIVAAPKQNYIRVRQSHCGENAEACPPTRTFFCPEGLCHEIISTNGDETSTGSSAATGANAAPGGTNDLAPNNEQSAQ